MLLDVLYHCTFGAPPFFQVVNGLLLGFAIGMVAFNQRLSF